MVVLGTYYKIYVAVKCLECNSTPLPHFEFWPLLQSHQDSSPRLQLELCLLCQALTLVSYYATQRRVE